MSKDEVIDLLLGGEFVVIELGDVLLVNGDEISVFVGELVNLLLFVEEDEMYLF